MPGHMKTTEHHSGDNGESFITGLNPEVKRNEIKFQEDHSGVKL